MSRSTKRNAFAAISKVINGEGGRVAKFEKVCDREVSHSSDCFMCGKGTKAKRMLVTKPRRTKEKKELREELRSL